MPKDLLPDTLILSKVNNKEKILKVDREKKTISYTGNPMRLASDLFFFLGETLHTRNEMKYSKSLNRRNHQPK